MKELTSLLAKSKGFPCESFSFNGNLSCDDVQEFLELYGKIIKELTLEDKMELSFVRKLLVIQAPNVQFLKLRSFRPLNDQDKLFPEVEIDVDDLDENSSAPQLSSLKSLELLNSDNSSSVRVLIKYTPTLHTHTHGGVGVD